MIMLFKIVSLMASAFERVDGQFLPSSGIARHRHISNPQLQRFDRRFIFVRGGSVDIEDPDESGDDDYHTAQDFISSFESELAEIRKEAELDAESELLKLLDLMQPRGEEEDDYDDDGVGVEENGDDDDEEGLDIIDGNSEAVVSEEVEYLDQPNEDDVTSTETSASITETLVSPGGHESDNDERVLFQEANLFVGLDEEDSGLNPYLEDSEDKANKRRKKGKSKSSKKRKKRKPESVSVAATLQEDSEQISAEQRKGVMFYLRTDVGRALTLFIATVILALLTKRMERQMNEQQNNFK